jgi:hypothetical protein
MESRDISGAKSCRRRALTDPFGEEAELVKNIRQRQHHKLAGSVEETGPDGKYLKPGNIGKAM